MKVVINKRYGGFGLSKEAYDTLGIEWDGYGYEYSSRDKRSDPDLVRVVEQLGKNANGRYSDLKVVEVPDDVEWTIGEYDGIEWVDEVHHSWG